MIQFPGSGQVVEPGIPAAREAEQDLDETPNLPAIIEPTSVELAYPDGFDRPRTSRRIERPAWLGVQAEHRRAAVDTVAHHTRAAAGRTAYELFSFRGGMPRRLGRCVRWFFLGLKGWPKIIGWVFAIQERSDVAISAKAPKGRKTGRGVSSGRGADRLSWWRGGVLVVPHIAGLFAIHHFLPGDNRLLWLVLAPAVIATVVYGAMHDTKPAPTLAAPRRQTDITLETLNAALRAIGILEKPTASRTDPDGVTIARLPRPVGGGWEVVFDLPASVKAQAADVVKLRGNLASSFATPYGQFQVEQGAHAGQVVIWQAPHDPFSARPVPHPLLQVESWSVFDPIPFGNDTRSRQVSVTVVGTHFLIGAVPNAGKTMASRVLTAGVVLDPTAELYIFDGKMGRDWSAVEPIATVYEAGPIRQQAARLVEVLEALIAEGDARFTAMRQMSDEECPDNKITPAMAAKGFGFKWLVIDEGHRHIGDEKYGADITRLIVDYEKGYRAAGMGFLFCTQDADAGLADRFTALRRVTGSRFALRTMDWQASNMILGDQMNTRGYNAAEILPSQQGTGIFRGDADADGQADQIARMVRTYYMDNADWADICERGRQLRGGAWQTLPAAAERKPVYVTSEDLFDLLADRAPDILGQVNATNAHEMGRLLPIKTEKTKKVVPGKSGTRRVYELGRVEVTLGLTAGCLTGDCEPTEPGGQSDAGQSPVGRQASPQSPTESPHQPSGTEN